MSKRTIQDDESQLGRDGSTDFIIPNLELAELGRVYQKTTIEITHERGPGTDGSWVWIDAFDIDGTPIAGGVTAGTGRIEQNNAALTYTGHWYANNSTLLSGGNASLAMDAGARASLSFTGSGVS